MHTNIDAAIIKSNNKLISYLKQLEFKWNNIFFILVRYFWLFIKKTMNLHYESYRIFFVCIYYKQHKNTIIQFSLKSHRKIAILLLQFKSNWDWHSARNIYDVFELPVFIGAELLLK